MCAYGKNESLANLYMPLNALEVNIYDFFVLSMKVLNWILICIFFLSLYRICFSFILILSYININHHNKQLQTNMKIKKKIKIIHRKTEFYENSIEHSHKFNWMLNWKQKEMNFCWWKNTRKKKSQKKNAKMSCFCLRWIFRLLFRFCYVSLFCLF